MPINNNYILDLFWILCFNKQLNLIGMKKALYLNIFVLILSQIATLSEDNIVIGIYTQEYIYGDHFASQSSAILTYIAPTYTNFA